MPAGPEPEFGLYLGVDHHPAWEHQNIDWPDFWIPRDSVRTARALQLAHARAQAGRRVEIACRGGRGRTGTALAAFAILAGVRPEDAVAWVREHYDRRAVETPWQHRWVRGFPRWLERG